MFSRRSQKINTIKPSPAAVRAGYIPSFSRWELRQTRTEVEATYSFVIGLLLLKLLHHNAPFFVLASLVLKPNPDDPRAEASHFYQLLFHEGVRSGIGSVAGPQGVKLFLIKNSPDSGCLLGLLVDVGPQSWLSGRDRFCCKGRGRRNRIPMSRKQGVCRDYESKLVGQGKVADGGGRVMNPLSKAIQALRSMGAAAASSALCTGGVTDISDSTDN